MNGPLVALTLQPDNDPGPPPSPLSDGDVAIFAAFIVIVASVLLST